ncbi:MAG: hypothetical protein KDI32_04110 [Pseudomonadales bacterium]|nr:hypothetical protein [Pseudomonadales bacterium]
MNALNRVVAAIAILAVCGLVVAGAQLVNKQDARRSVEIAPAAEDTLVQSADLTQIVSFRYINDHTLEVKDDRGRPFTMEFTAKCDGLEKAKSFSLITHRFNDLDRFDGIAIAGHICNFKKFARKIVP